MPKFRTKRGRITRYALACGYAEAIQSKRLWLEQISSNGTLRVTLEGRELYIGHNLTTARQIYDHAKRSAPNDFS